MVDEVITGVTLAPENMKHNVYDLLVVAGNFGMLDFVSTGPQGKIIKRIRILPTTRPEVFDVWLSDAGRGGGSHDEVISNNGDRDKVLATVMYALEFYTLRYPRRWLYFRGNTKLRNRLYRMAISRDLDKLSMYFYIYVDVHQELRPFSTGIEADGFLIKRKFE